MSADEYLLLATTISALALAVAIANARREKKTAKASKEVTRWRRFRVRPTVLRESPTDATAAVKEEPKGLQLLASQGGANGRRRLRSKDGKRRIDIARGWDLFRRKHVLSLDGRSWARLASPRRGAGRVSIEVLSGEATYKLRGSLAEREYEILKDGKVGALVSWQDAPEEGSARTEYVLEVVKTEDPLPWIAIAMAVEAVLA